MLTKLTLVLALTITVFGLVGCPRLGVYLQPEGSSKWASEDNPWFPHDGNDIRSNIQILAMQFPSGDIEVAFRVNAICDSASFLLSRMTLEDSFRQPFRLKGALLSSAKSIELIKIDPDSAIPLYADSSRFLITNWTRETKPEDARTNRGKGYDTILIVLGSIRCAKEGSVVELGLVKLVPGEAIRYR